MALPVLVFATESSEFALFSERNGGGESAPAKKRKEWTARESKRFRLCIMKLR